MCQIRSFPKQRTGMAVSFNCYNNKIYGGGSQGWYIGCLYNKHTNQLYSDNSTFSCQESYAQLQSLTSFNFSTSENETETQETEPEETETDDGDKDTDDYQSLFEYNFENPNAFTAITICLVTMATLLTILSWVHAKYSSKYECISSLCGINDSVSFSSVSLFFIHCHGFFIDVTFAIYLNLRKYFVLSIICIVFIVLSYISSLMVYVFLSKDWSSVNQHTNNWLQRRSTILFRLATFTGSLFPAIELCNSNMFGLLMFNMRLTNVQLFKFRTFKLAALMFFEKIPELIITFVYSQENGNFDSLSLLAFVFNIIILIGDLSIFLTNIIEKKRLMYADYFSVVINITLSNQKEYKLALKRYKLLSLLRNFIIASMEGTLISNQGIETLYCRPVIDCKYRDHGMEHMDGKEEIDDNNDHEKVEKSNEIEYGFTIAFTIPINKDDNENDTRNRLSKICQDGILPNGLKSIWKLSNEIDSDKIVLHRVELIHVNSSSSKENVIQSILDK